MRNAGIGGASELLELVERITRIGGTIELVVRANWWCMRIGGACELVVHANW